MIVLRLENKVLGKIQCMFLLKNSGNWKFMYYSQTQYLVPKMWHCEGMLELLTLEKEDVHYLCYYWTLLYRY